MRFHFGSLALAITLFLSGLRALQTESGFSLLEVRERSAYTPDEDQLLRELREQNPKLTWAEIAKSFPRHSIGSVKQRYESYLKPNFMPDRYRLIHYTTEEDRLLKELKEEKGLSWENIAESFAEQFPRRTARALERHYGRFLRSEPAQELARPYTLDEDQCLEVLKRRGLPWHEIVSYFPGRTVLGLKKRWNGYLKVELDLDRQITNFTPEEDELLIRLKGQGLTWAEIVKSFKGRTLHGLQTRWYVGLKPKKESELKWSEYTPEEDQRLIRLKGEGLKWAEIVEHFEGRSLGGLRQRWKVYLKPKMEQ